MAEQDTISDVIATRRLQLDDSDVVEVFVGRPTEDLEGLSFGCQIQIKGLGPSRVIRIGGEDSMQALFLALQAIGARLCTSSEAKAGRLQWLGQRCPFGFPLADSIADLAES